MRKEKEKTINNMKFKVTQLSYAEFVELSTTLGHIIGPTLSDQKIFASPTAMVGNIISRLSSAEIMSITNTLAKSTRIEREPGRWPILDPEVDLAGEYDLTLKWLSFALEVNYGSFFVEGGLLSGVLKPAVASPI